MLFLHFCFTVFSAVPHLIHPILLIYSQTLNIESKLFRFSSNGTRIQSGNSQLGKKERKKEKKSTQHGEKILRDSSRKLGGVVTTKLMEQSDTGDQEPRSKQLAD